MTARYVYRVYDGNDTLIYVGSTKDLTARLRTHANAAWWAPQAVKVKAKVYADAAEALLVERDAIRSLHPRWNLNWQAPRAEWTPEQWADYIRAKASNINHYTERSRKQIASAERRLRLVSA